MGTPVVKMRDPLSFSEPGSHAVTTASTEAVAANGARKYLVITNLSETQIFVGVGEAAVAGKGIVLTTVGSDYEFIPGQNLSLAAINVIHSGIGNKNVAIQEAT